MRLMGALGLVVLVSAVPVRAVQDLIKDPDGKTLAVVLDCNSCADPGKGQSCYTGAETGFLDGKACGKCLLDANFPTRIPYPYDLQLIGYLKDEDGKPLKGKFVRLHLPNTWTVRTRTLEDGMFRLLLGATAERKGKGLVIKLGDRVVPKSNTAPEYALFMMPDPYKPCAAAPAAK